MKKTDNEKFKAACKRNGWKVRLYQGRWFWKGYAVETDNWHSDEDQPTMKEVVKSTRVKLQSDSMGMGRIVYPRQSMTDEEWLAAQEKGGD